GWAHRLGQLAVLAGHAGHAGWLASLVQLEPAPGHPRELEMSEHDRGVLGEAHDGVRRPLGEARRSHAVGAGEIVDEERTRGLFGDERVDPRQVAPMTGQGAAVAVAAEEEAALALAAGELD